MKFNTFEVGWVAGLATAIVIGFFVNRYVRLDVRVAAVEQGCAHYDAKTGDFTWNGENGE